jgi:drug/metabolite transporter (DMT)-like permease
VNIQVKNPARADDAAGPADIGARLMLVVLCVVWGVTWPVIKLALEGIPPLSMRTLSLGLGTMTLFAVCLVTRRRFRIPNVKAWIHIVIASVLNIAAFTVLTSFAQMATTTSRVSILAYTMPIWSVPLAWLFLDERPTRIQAIALALCTAGLGILIYPLAVHGVPLGILLTLIASVGWAAGTVYLKWAHIDADPMAAACWQLAVAFVLVATCTFAYQGRLELGGATFKSVLATLFSGIIGSGAAYGLWFAIVRRLPAGTASLGLLSVPVVGVVASMIILGEVPTATDVFGFALIFAASACVLLTRRSVPEAASQPT